MIWIIIALLVAVIALLFWNYRLGQKCARNFNAFTKAEDRHYQALARSSEFVIQVAEMGLENVTLLDKIDILQAELAAQKQYYEALDEGAQEVQEGYEQEFLTMSERIEALVKQRDQFANHAAAHFALCIPDLITIKDFEGFEEEFWKPAPIYDQLQVELVPNWG